MVPAQVLEGVQQEAAASWSWKPVGAPSIELVMESRVLDRRRLIRA